MSAAPGPSPIDPSAQRAWRVGEMRRQGMSRRYVDSPEWTRPSRGVRLWLPPGAREPDDRIQAAAAVLSGGSGLGGWAAALLHGVEWADGRARDGRELLVPVVVPAHGFAPARRGIQARRSEIGDDDLCLRSGLTVTSGVRTAFDTVRWAPSLGDAVAWLDAMCRAKATTPEAVEAYALARPGWIGIRRVREAVRLVDAAAKSPQESRLRVEWLAAGLPKPRVNTTIWTLDGELVGEGDLLDPESGFVAEYDGWVHRRRDRRELDHGRGRRFADVGLTVRTYVDRDLAGPPAFLHASLRAGLAAARTVRRRLWTLDPDCFWE